MLQDRLLKKLIIYHKNLFGHQVSKVFTYNIVYVFLIKLLHYVFAFNYVFKVRILFVACLQVY